MKKIHQQNLQEQIQQKLNNIQVGGESATSKTPPYLLNQIECNVTGFVQWQQRRREKNKKNPGKIKIDETLVFRIQEDQ